MSKLSELSCFKAYDVRGELNVEINEEIAFKIGYATAKKLKARNVVVGHDARESSPSLANSVIKGVQSYGANVLNLGFAGTEEVYFAVTDLGADAGIEVTASHNPIKYNGMKIVKSSSKPLTGDEFSHIKLIAEKDKIAISTTPGWLKDFGKQARMSYIKKIVSFINLNNLQPLKIVLNSGNGVAGPVIDELETYLKLMGVDTEFIKVHHEPDPSFPNGIPNPLIEDNRVATTEAVNRVGADFGVAFDGDFDRCFLFDNLGNFIPSEYIVGMLAELFLKKEKGATIVHDSRVVFNISNIISNFGGNAVISKSGHAFMKAEMRACNAVYGGEMTAHHYFRDFNFCDSGMIPWLMIWEFLSKARLSLSDIFAFNRNSFLSSGELNFSISDPSGCLDKIKTQFHGRAIKIDEIDGVSLRFKEWRFNIRKSNTEPLIRLNVETLSNKSLLQVKVSELSKLVQNY